ncbi:Redoxin [Reichenbachiella faecimaris]|uniref:Redoxin n=1 Tax=Reichenbachiella faecimaris TaxID=692418 RepID=A0A1W2GNN7_REIFA|nr:redoxin family protein [Reichenbachiella faecimaris]SMD38279.1 Redoxin [Reichenbachiella faecimaris]
MNRKLILTLAALLASAHCYCQNLISKDLRLYNVKTDSEISINHFNSHSAVVMVFTSINCPYAKLYKDRVAALSQQYIDQNVRFVFVNANTTDPSRKETIAHMKEEVSSMHKDVHYFADKNHSVRKSLNVEKNPEVIILTPSSQGFQKVYQGAIDDSPQSESLVKKNYIEMTLNNVLSNQAVSIAYQKPIGCRIK